MERVVVVWEKIRGLWYYSGAKYPPDTMLRTKGPGQHKPPRHLYEQVCAPIFFKRLRIAIVGLRLKTFVRWESYGT